MKLSSASGKTNPKQTQSNPIQTQSKPKQTRFEAKTNPIKPKHFLPTSGYLPPATGFHHFCEQRASSNPESRATSHEPVALFHHFSPFFSIFLHFLHFFAFFRTFSHFFSLFFLPISPNSYRPTCVLDWKLLLVPFVLT